MHQAFLFITLCVQGGIALSLFKSSSSFIPNPRATTLKDIQPDEMKCPQCAEAKLKNWDIDITTYNHSDVISRTLKAEGAWEEKAIQRACNEYQIHGGRGNMLDIGGNIGAFALPLARCLELYSHDNGYLIAVDAIKNNSQKFRASMKRNSFYNIHLYEYAVSSPDAKDTVTVSEHQGNHGHAVVINASHDNAPETFEYKTPVTTIDAIAKVEGNQMKRIFFLKLDIDGHEPQMLQGAEQFMKNNGPCIIFSEFFSPYTKGYLETGSNPTPVDKNDKKLIVDTAGSDIKKKTKALLEKWGYNEYLEETGTGGLEGWFRHKNWKDCVRRMQ